MKKRRFLAYVISLIMLLAICGAANADGLYYNFHGSCVRFFVTTESLSRNTSGTIWVKFTVKPTALYYQSGVINYAYAIPMLNSGQVCGSNKKVTKNNETSFTPDSVGKYQDNIKFKLINAHYENYGTQSNKLTIGGEVRGTYADEY